MQGFGVQILPSQISEPAFLATILEVLTTSSCSDIAQAMSLKIRATKRTPVQEGAGDEVAQGFLNELLTVMTMSQFCASVKMIDPVWPD